MTMRSLNRLLFDESIQRFRRCYSFMRCRCPEYRTAANSLAGSRCLQHCLKLITQTCCPQVVGDRLITLVSRPRQDFLKPKTYRALRDIDDQTRKSPALHPLVKPRPPAKASATINPSHGVVASGSNGAKIKGKPIPFSVFVVPRPCMMTHISEFLREFQPAPLDKS